MRIYCVSQDEEAAKKLLASCPCDLVSDCRWVPPDAAKKALKKGWDGKAWEMWLLPVPSGAKDVILKYLAVQLMIPGDPLKVFHWSQYPQRRGILVVEGDPPDDLPELFPLVAVPKGELDSRWSTLIAVARLGFFDIRDRFSGALIKRANAETRDAAGIEDRILGYIPGPIHVKTNLSEPAADLVVRALGNPRDPLLVGEFVNHVSHVESSPAPEGGTAGPCSEEEILSAATLARTCTFVASRNFEGNPLLTSLVVAGARALDDSQPGLHPNWIVRMPRPTRFDLAPAEGAERLARLVDGKNSYLVADSRGRVVGIADTEELGLPEIARRLGGYGFLTTPNDGVTFFCCGRMLIHYNGFEWRRDAHRQALRGVVGWAASSSDEAIIRRKRAFYHLIEQLSLYRLPSIVILCERAAHDELREKGVVRPMQEELEGLAWDDRSVPQKGLLGMLRLDGAHFFSRDFNVLSVCQRIAVPPNVPTRNMGTGTAAARYLSRLLGERGYVIKVSGDGPVLVFHDGRGAV